MNKLKVKKRKLSFLGIENIKTAIEEVQRAEIVLKVSVWEGKDKSLSYAIAVLNAHREKLKDQIKGLK